MQARDMAPRAMAIFNNNDFELEDHLVRMVNDAKLDEAAAINNQGYIEQLQYLLDAGYQVEDILEELNDVA